MLGVSSNIISRPLTTGGYHSRWRRGGRRAPQTRVRAARARHSRPQNTHTRHRTEQAAKDTQRVPTRVPSTGTHGLPAALHSACCSFQSWLFMPFAPVGLLLSLSPPAGSAALGTCHLIIMQGHAASLPCNSGLPIADTATLAQLVEPSTLVLHR